MSKRALRQYRKAEAARCTPVPCGLSDAMREAGIDDGVETTGRTLAALQGDTSEGATAAVVGFIRDAAESFRDRSQEQPIDPVEVDAASWRTMVATYGEDKTRRSLDGMTSSVHAPGWYVVGMGDDGPRSEP